MGNAEVSKKGDKWKVWHLKKETRMKCLRENKTFGKGGWDVTPLSAKWKMKL